MTTSPPPLSPAAQAVSDAAYKAWITEDRPSSIAAAALIAAADQPYEVPPQYRGDDYWMYRRGVEAVRDQSRAIAAELRREGQP
jgi:hypothetical protein